MARFSEILSIAVIASALVNTRVHCSPISQSIQSESENQVESNGIPAAGDNDDLDSAPPAVSHTETEELDSNCDCEDEEALFHKLIRQIIDTSVLKDKAEFLKQFPIKRLCGSDGKFYSTECELQCTRIKSPGHEDISDFYNLHRVHRGKCRRVGKGRMIKGKENPRKLNKMRSHHPSPDQLERMQRPENDKETLVCICPRNWYPVCASNGVTYGNKCAFDCAKENVDSELTIVTLRGSCKEDDKTVI